MFRFRKCQLELLSHLASEVVTADRNTSVPDAEPIGNDHICRFGSDGEHHVAGGWRIRVKGIWIGTVIQQVISNAVVDGHWSELNSV